MLNKTIYSLINVAPQAAIQADNWRYLLSMRPLMVTCATPCQFVPTPARAFGDAHVRRGLSHVPWEKAQTRLPAKKRY